MFSLMQHQQLFVAAQVAGGYLITYLASMSLLRQTASYFTAQPAQTASTGIAHKNHFTVCVSQLVDAHLPTHLG
jgi:hypothetical protein